MTPSTAKPAPTRPLLAHWAVRALPLLLAACSSQPSDPSPVLATYHQHELTEADLQRLAPNADTQARKQFVRRWYVDHLMREQALKAMPDLADSLTPLIDDYRLRLEADAYRRHLLMTAKLDTHVSDSAIRAYYSQYSHQFLAMEDLVNFAFVLTRNQDTPDLLNRLPSSAPKDLETVETWCRQYADTFAVEDVYQPLARYQALLARYPQVYTAGLDPGDPVRYTTLYLNGEYYAFFLYLRDAVNMGQPLPLPVVRERIHNLILMQRQRRLIETTERDLYDLAQPQLPPLP